MKKMIKLGKENIFKMFCYFSVMLLIVLLAWNTDDAYHGYVMSRNLAEGNGLVYNIGERVNASTCPFFTIIVAGVYFLIGDMFLGGILTNLITSGIAVWIVIFLFCRDKKTTLFAVLALGGGIAFVTFATSGLENSFLFMFMALIIYHVTKHDKYNEKALFLLAFLIGLLAWTRMDNVLLVLPIGIYAFFFQREKTISWIKAVAIGFAGIAPFWLWLLFSLFYYGFLFPNTAYSKLGAGISLLLYLKRGISYFLTAIMNDPILLMLPIAYFIYSLYKKNKVHFMLALGCMLYWAYILYIGGDFMLGRHFTVPFFVSVAGLTILLSESKEQNANCVMYQRIVSLALVCVVFANSFGHLEGTRYLWGGDKNIFKTSGVADERGYYYKNTNLINYLLNGDEALKSVWGEVTDPESGLLGWAPGITVYYYYHDYYSVDGFALADAFLVRVPWVGEEDQWRVGHLQRVAPDGYAETLATGVNQIQNPELHDLYDIIAFITRGPLFSIERLKAIVKVNLGYY